jgi:hypothetical protein
MLVFFFAARPQPLKWVSQEFDTPVVVASPLATAPQAHAASACVTFDPSMVNGSVYVAPVGLTPGSVVLFSNNF